MTKAAALYNFFSSFGIDAYPASAVPAKVKLPYLTYELSTDDWYGDDVSIAVNLWYHTEGEATPNAMVEKISKRLSGGTIIVCTGGAIWIKKGSPFSVSLSDESDGTIKRRSLNLTLDYLTA